jgi:hypothetical protein
MKIYTVTFASNDCLMNICCHSREHADRIAASLPDPLEVHITPATQAEIE